MSSCTSANLKNRKTLISLLLGRNQRNVVWGKEVCNSNATGRLENNKSIKNLTFFLPVVQAKVVP